MVGTSSPTSSSSSSSCPSVGSFADDNTSTRSASAVKFLCSYGGMILPRHPDGRLRYVGGDTRVLSVDRSVTFSELIAKMGELCGRGGAVGLRCRMPTEDLDALVSITSDEDLASLIEEYDLAGGGGGGVLPPKIRALLHPPPPPPPPPKAKSASSTPRPPVPATGAHRCCVRHAATLLSAGRPGQGARRVQHHHGNHWQYHL